MRIIHATREQLIEWIRFKAGEVSIHDVSDELLVLMAGGLEVGDVVVTPSGQRIVKR